VEPKKYEYIDSLRGIAVSLVVLVHVAYIYDNQVIQFLPDLVHQFFRNGQLGVQLFFIASALTLTMSWNNRLSETKKVKKFFIRRFFRIAPLFYLAIIYFTFDIFLGFDFSSIDFSNVPLKKMITSFLFINGLFPTHINGYVPGGWSITVEFMFYAMAPFLFTKIKNINTSIAFVLLSLLVSYFVNTYFIGSFTNHEEFLYYSIISQLPVFSLGILCYWIINYKDDTISRKNLVLLAFTLFIFCYLTIPYHFLYSLIFAVIVIIQSKNPIKLLSNRILAKIGKVSFSMYLVHFAVLSVLDRVDWANMLSATNTVNTLGYIILTYIVVFICSYIISNLTYKFIEIPGMNFGKKLVKKLDATK